MPRKVLSSSLPAIPLLARKLHLEGKVKIEATVAANGSVLSVKMIGGSPVFEINALAAVKQWKFEKAERETPEIVVVNFHFE